MHTRLSALAAAALVAACGGSGSGDSATDAGTPPAAAITISGKAAGATALAGRATQARCRAGTGEATTDADGRYEMRIASGSFPCVMRVDRGAEPALHSVATSASATTGTATANITPVTELVVAQLSGTAPATYYGTGFEGSAGSAVTVAAVTAAATQVTQTLAAAGIALAGAGDPVTASLVTAGDTSGAAANAYGQALAQLDSALKAAATPLAALSSAVAAASPAATAPVGGTASLPPVALLQTAASNCTNFRSGRYRAIYNGESPPEVITIDAPALRATRADGSSFSLTADGTCRYRTPAGGEMAVSRGGLLVGQSGDAPFRGVVMFPEQVHGLAALAGTWNSLSLDRPGNGARPQLTSTTLTIAADGRVTAITFCETVTGGCESGTRGVDAGFPDISVAVNPAGGFTMTNATDRWSEPLFVYQAGTGERMVVTGSVGSGHLSLATPAVARTLPPVGRVSESLNLNLVPNAVAPFYTAPTGFTPTRNTIASTDPAAGSFVRNNVVNMSTGVTVPETVQGNVPRLGYSRRVPGVATASDGSTRTIAEWVALSLAGTGISIVGILSSQNLILSVDKPE